MNKTKEKIIIDTVNCTVELLKFDDEDKKQWKELFDSWMLLRNGMEKFEARRPNIPEGLTEAAFCMATGSYRKVKVTYVQKKKDSDGNYIRIDKSFDTYNPNTFETEQIKATSMENSDLSSFGPKSKQHKLYFMDFNRSGIIDGSFDLYEVDVNLINQQIVNKTSNQTAEEQKGMKRRPRLSIAEIITANNILPSMINVKVWE